MSQLLFDARSAGSPRMTGWERYTRGVLSIVSPMKGVSVRATHARSVLGRVAEDAVALPLASRGFQYTHFPSLPPGYGFDLRRAIYTLHDLTWWKYPETSSLLGRTYYKRLAERAARSEIIVTVSQAVKDEILEMWPSAEVRVISPFVSLGAGGASPAAVRDRPYFLAVGSIEPRKNLARLAEGFALSRLSRDFDLVFVGRIAWGSVPDGVVHVGAVSDSVLTSLIRGAQTVFVPSLYEGFGLPVAEALALGTRVACSDIPVFREVGGANAQYFDPLSAEAIAQQFCEQAFSVPGRDCVTDYTRDGAERQVKALYRELEIDF